MGVLLGDPAVCRPAGVADPDRRAGGPGGGLEVGELPDRPDDLEPAVGGQREPGGVVAAVLEAGQPAQDQIPGRPAPGVADDPAHAPAKPWLARSRAVLERGSYCVTPHALGYRGTGRTADPSRQGRFSPVTA